MCQGSERSQNPSGVTIYYIPDIPRLRELSIVSHLKCDFFDGAAMIMTLRDEQISENVANLFGAGFLASTNGSSERAWPPVMIRDFMRVHDTQTLDVDDSMTIGYVADCLSSSASASIAVYDAEDNFLGIAVDEDAMALIKRDGVRALDYPITEAVQRNRPVCSITDSPFVVLNMMRNEGWDRVGVSEHGKIIGVVHRRHLVNFVDD